MGDEYPKMNAQDGPHLCDGCLPTMRLADRGYVDDPFADEIHGKAVPSWMCSGCYYESCMEI